MSERYDLTQLIVELMAAAGHADDIGLTMLAKMLREVSDELVRKYPESFIR